MMNISTNEPSTCEINLYLYYTQV